MNILKRLLPNNAPSTAAEIATALDAARAERTAASTEQAALADRRAEALVSGSDATVDRIEAEQAGLARRLDRLDAAISRLEARHAAQTQAEGDAAIEAQATEAQEAVDELAAVYSEIDVATNEMQQLFNKAAPLAAKIDAWNRRGHPLGRGRLMYTTIDVIRQRTKGAI